MGRLEARVDALERRMAAFDRRIAVLGRNARFQVALAFSAALHAVVILGVTFRPPAPPHLDRLAEPLEVTLVNARTRERPARADALAQANLDGGGNVETRRRARSPLPLVREPKPAAEVAAAARRLERLEREARELLAQPGPKPAVAPAAEPPQPEAGPSGVELRARALEIARLEAQIAKQWDAYQQRPRRRFIGARAQEFRFARYIEDWRLKIERIGELNYPQAAREQKLYGSLVVTVSIKSDGSLEGVEINRPSGRRILDEAAIRIVRLAAPFAPFPPDIARDTDILSITRTWLFTRSDQFIAE